MKKFLRFLVALVAIVVAALLILGLVEPKEVIVTRSMVIKAPKDVVFTQIQYFKNWPNWSPWYKMDSAKIKMTYSGTDGMEGSSYHWEGGDKTGAGDMKNMGLAGTLLNYEVDFTKPYKSSSQGIFKAEDSAGMTKVTWNCDIKMSYPMNAMLLFMNMDKMLGGDFENGLANMKKYVESNSVAASDNNITEVDYAAHTFEGFHKTVSWADMGKFYMDSYTALGKDLGGKISGPASGIFYTWDTVNKNTDMVACFPVSDTTKPVKDASIIHVAGAKAVMAVMKGGYSKEMETHTAIAKYMAAKGLKQSLVVEEYAVGQHQNPDSTQWVTNIYYLEKQ